MIKQEIDDLLTVFEVLYIIFKSTGNETSFDRHSMVWVVFNQQDVYISRVTRFEFFSSRSESNSAVLSTMIAVPSA